MKNGWSFRNYLFEWDRIDDLRGLRWEGEENTAPLIDLPRPACFKLNRDGRTGNVAKARVESSWK